MSLFSEISSIFLNYNDQLKHYSDHPLMIVNQLIFFLTFTVTRIIMFPWIFYILSKTALIFHSSVSSLRKWSMIVCLIQAAGIIILNFYWYRIICKKVYRIFYPKPKVEKKD